MLGNPLVIAQAFLRLVPRFKSHWKVRNKTAFSRDVHPVSSPRIFFVIPVQDIALIYSITTNKTSDSSMSVPIYSVHCFLNVGYLNTQCWSVCPTLMSFVLLLELCCALPMGTAGCTDHGSQETLCFKSSITEASTPCKTQQDPAP